MRAIGAIVAILCLSMTQNQVFAASDIFYFESFDRIGYSNATSIYGGDNYVENRSTVAGILGDEWTLTSTNDGRQRIYRFNTQTANGVLVMDDNANETSPNNAYALNEAILALDFRGYQNIVLEFDSLDYYDDNNPLPATFTGSVNGDGVAVSADGVNWITVTPSSFFQPDGSNSWQTNTIDISKVISDNNLQLKESFYIKFQQYDNGMHEGGSGTYTYSSSKYKTKTLDKRDARKFDNVALWGELKGTSNGPAPSVPEPTTATLFGVGLLALTAYRKRRRTSEVSDATA